jgi:CubicO group peptidase (beta-lactamase class C family)
MKRTQQIADFLALGAQKGVYSGAQAAWCIGEKGPAHVVCAGTTQKDSIKKIAPDTLFDIASVTKIFAASAALRMVDRGALPLDAPLKELVPALSGGKQESAVLAELLAHEAGFADWLPLFEQVPKAQRGTATAKEMIIQLALHTEGSAPPGKKTIYSDLGFIVLQHILEETGKSSLEQLLKSEITEPLGLGKIGFNPTLSVPATDVAATEDCPWRGRLLAGEVHDDNAWSMGGVSAHAGLFAPASEVAMFGAAWLSARTRGDCISRDLAVKATTPRPLGRGLGWDFKSPTGSSAGRRFGPRSFGHLGFTGCSLWVDPDRNLSVALNTNRVHFGRNNVSIREFRPKFHDLLIETFEI